MPQQPSSVLIITSCLPPLCLTQITIHCVRKTLCSHYVCLLYVCVFVSMCAVSVDLLFFIVLWGPLSLLCSNTITRPPGHWNTHTYKGTHTQRKIERNLSGLCKAHNSFYNEGKGSKGRMSNITTLRQAMQAGFASISEAADGGVWPFSTTTWPESICHLWDFRVRLQTPCQPRRH